MSRTTLLLFPNQLFVRQIARDFCPSATSIVLIRHPHFFERLRFHRVKIAYLYSCTAAAVARLQKHGFDVKIVTCIEQADKTGDVHYYDTIDHTLQKEIPVGAIRHESPAFVLSSKQAHAARPRLTDVYGVTRAKSRVLEGVKSTDQQNRRSFGTDVEFPKMRSFGWDSLRQTAASLADKYPHALGTSQHLDLYPVTEREAIERLEEFLRTRFSAFGSYQDAMSPEVVFGFHSCLSAAINVGLLTPDRVIRTTIKYARAHATPLNSVEGFVRQVLGWRELSRVAYVRGISNGNHFGCTRRLRWDLWRTGKTGIEVLDAEIGKALEYGYAHHIVRLMVFLNLMVLCRVRPEDVVRWFSEVVAIDAYDWVMQFNVRCMGYYDGGAVTRKPYLASSAYVSKMSGGRYPRCGEWDALFYAFLHENRSLLVGGASMYTRNMAFFDRQSLRRRREILKSARATIERLTLI